MDEVELIGKIRQKVKELNTLLREAPAGIEIEIVGEKGPAYFDQNFQETRSPMQYKVSALKRL